MAEFGTVRFSRQPATSTSTPAVKTPAVAHQQTISNFNNRWATRVSALSQAKGIDLQAHVKPVWLSDKKRVQQGKQPYTDTQVADFISTLRHNKAMVDKKVGGGGILSHVGSDIGQITAGLNPMRLVPALYKGGLGADAFASRVTGDILSTHKYKPGETTPVTGLLNSLQSWIPGYKSQAKEVAKTVEQANKMGVKEGVPFGLRHIPGVNMVPGTYTTANVLSDPSQITQHPIFTLLDVLPYAGRVGKAAAGLRYGDAAATVDKSVAEGIIPKDSAWEAMADGQPLKAATRATGITGPESKITQWAQRAGVSKDIRNEAGYQAQALREGSVDPSFKLLRDGYKRIQNFQYAKMVKAQSVLSEIEDRIKTAEKTPGSEVTGIMRHELDQAHEALTKASEDYKSASKDVQRVSSADFINHVWQNNSTPKEMLLESLKEQGHTATTAETFINNNYTDLFEWSGRWSVDKAFKEEITGGDGTLLHDQMVPKYMTDALDRLNRRTAGIDTKAFQATTNVFKYAVLTGPRHVVHVLFSNGMFMALDSMEVFAQAREALRMALEKDPSKWPTGLQRGVGIWGKTGADELRNLDTETLQKAGFKAEDIHAIQHGKTLGRLLKEHWAFNKTPLALANPFAYRRMEEFITDMSRAMEYLHGRNQFLKSDEAIAEAERNLAPGVKNSMQLGKAMKAAEGPANEAGVQQALKVLMDVDHMSPLERQVIRQVIPFYPFTRQLLRYMMTYPAEHPMKAAVLAAVGRMEMEDAGTGLPMKFMSLFPITGADKNGNATYIDTKNMNPFRQMNGTAPWTLAGFLSSLNPLISTPFEAAGVNVLSATPELYPQLTVDPNTGDLVMKHKNILEQAAGNIVPQFQNIEGMMGWSQKLTDLKHNDPQAYQRMFWSNLNLPFNTAPRNLNEEKIRYARNKYSVAQQDVSQAVKSGKIDSLPYDVIPYQGKLYTKAELKKQLGQ